VTKAKAEKWMFIPDTNREYKISNYGRVCSLKGLEERFLKEDPNSAGYPRAWVTLSNGTRYRFFIHRMVYSLFKHQPLTRDDIVHHKDYTRTNYTLGNLKKMKFDRHVALHTKGTTRGLCPRVSVDIFKGKKFVSHFDTMAEASRYLSVSPVTISMCASGEFKTIAGGYSVSYSK
jgi:hypothetical protein